MVLGGAQMRNSPAILPLPQDPDTWQCVGGRCFPLMTVRYVGALKEYLAIPAMALFGTGAGVVRAVGVFWAVLGVYGIGRMFGPAPALLMAVSPSLAGHTVFDNGAVAGWIGALGLVCIAVTRYGEVPGATRAFVAGVTLGLAVWARANFLWIAAAGAVGWSPGLIGWVRANPRHVGLVAAGSVVGATPFLIYQAVSGFGTFEAVGMFSQAGSWTDRLGPRAAMWAESLVCGREYRSIWGGGPVPQWQVFFPAVVLVLGWLWSLRKSGAARGAAVALAIFYGFLFFSRLPVAEHHFVPALPLAAAVAALGWTAAPRLVALAAAGLYTAVCLSWHYQAHAGLRATGGIGQWSSAILDVKQHLESKQAGRETRILDWGLQNSLFVLSDTRLRTREDFDSHWGVAVGQGGLFLTNSASGTFFPKPYGGFHRALALAGYPVEPMVFRERTGRIFAELWDLPPSPPRFAPPKFAKLEAGNPAHGAQFVGVHEIEQGVWRWTRGRFALLFPAQSGARTLTVDLHVAASVISRLGPVTLSAWAGEHRLNPETFHGSADYTFQRPVPEGAGDPLAVHFALDRYLAAGAVDPRELGLVIKAASVE